MPEELIREGYSLTQSGRTVWNVNLTVAELLQVAPVRENQDLTLFTDTNRPVTTRHRDGIIKFLSEYSDWALPPVALAARPGQITGNGGTVTLPADGSINVLDGQHRVQALYTLQAKRKEEETEAAGEENSGGHAKLLAEGIPVIIYEVRNNEEQAQLFSWFGRSRSVENAIREYYDRSDPYGASAKEAIVGSSTLNGKVTWHTASVPKKGEEANALLTFRELKTISTTIQTGIRKAPTPEQRKACREDDALRMLTDDIVELFDEFLPSCLPIYAELKGHVRLDRSVSHALHPQTLRLVANTWARWKRDRNQGPEHLRTVITKLNMKMADPGNDLIGRLALMDGLTLRFKRPSDRAWDLATAVLLDEAEELRTTEEEPEPGAAAAALI